MQARPLGEEGLCPCPTGEVEQDVGMSPWLCVAGGARGHGGAQPWDPTARPSAGASKPSRGSPDPKHPQLRPCKATEVLCERRDVGILFCCGGFLIFFFFFFLFKVPHCLNVPTERSDRRACWLLLRLPACLEHGFPIHTSGEGLQLLPRGCQ